MRIIVDAMGGDNAPHSTVRGALQAAKEYGVDIILVGRGEDILNVLNQDGIADLPCGGGDRPRPSRWWTCATTQPPPLRTKRTRP